MDNEEGGGWEEKDLNGQGGEGVKPYDRGDSAEKS